MSMSRKIADALESKGEWSLLPRAVSVDDGPHRLSLRLTASEAVGLAFESLEFAPTEPPAAGLSAADLRGWGDRLSARVTYLMEPLVVLEVDEGHGQVELRSQAPTVRAGSRSYYEARLDRSGTLNLGRIAFDEATRRRQPVPCRLTHEVLERLADDLVATAVA